jgi:hypothetical protein
LRLPGKGAYSPPTGPFERACLRTELENPCIRWSGKTWPSLSDVEHALVPGLSGRRQGWGHPIETHSRPSSIQVLEGAGPDGGASRRALNTWPRYLERMSALAPFDFALGLVAALAPIAILVAALLLVLRLVASGDVKRGILYIVFLPGRQRVLVRWFVLMTLFFLAGTTLDGLTLLSVVPPIVDSIGGATSDIGAAIALLFLLQRGLSPQPLSDAEVAELRSQPRLLAALAITRD